MGRKLSRLRLERLKAGLTQVELSLQSGVPQSVISNAENGRPVLNERNRMALSDFFQVDGTELLKEVAL